MEGDHTHNLVISLGLIKSFVFRICLDPHSTLYIEPKYPEKRDRERERDICIYIYVDIMHGFYLLRDGEKSWSLAR